MNTTIPQTVAYQTTSFATSKALYAAGIEKPRTHFYWLQHEDDSQPTVIIGDSVLLQRLAMQANWQVYPAWQFEELRKLVPYNLEIIRNGARGTLVIQLNEAYNLFFEDFDDRRWLLQSINLDSNGVEALGKLLLWARHNAIIAVEDCQPKIAERV